MAEDDEMYDFDELPPVAWSVHAPAPVNATVCFTAGHEIDWEEHLPSKQNMVEDDEDLYDFDALPPVTLSVYAPAPVNPTVCFTAGHEIDWEEHIRRE